ncbi:MAG: transcription elongation factor GreA [Lachnospiraceae bacterium]|nr:transcription elongation factor GreA [Lachnospiraceae bacterium]
MHDRLTREDIEKMQREVDERKEAHKALLEAVKEARAQGDLSENFEYYAAKREKGQNESRIRYLENMIKTAVVIEDHSGKDEVGLNDVVTLYIPDDDEEMEVTLVTTILVDAMKNRISIESPMGKAIRGHKKGDTVYVELENGAGYEVEIRDIRPYDGEEMQIQKF